MNDPIKLLHQSQSHYTQAAAAASDAFGFIAGSYEPEILDDEEVHSYQKSSDEIENFLDSDDDG